MAQINEHLLPIFEDGVHTWYYENDYDPNPCNGIYREVITNDGCVIGPFKQYTEDGTLQIKTTFEDGTFNGQYEEYYPETGIPKLVMYFENDTPIKLIQTWFQSGNIRSRIPMNDDGRRTGWSEEYFDTDKHRIPKIRVMYSDGDKHGNAYKFYKSGKIMCKSVFNNDKLHGPYMSYHPNGQLKVECTFVHGLLSGKYISHYVNGNTKKVIYFQEGALTGRAFFYSQNNKVKTSCGFSEGKFHGAYHSFDDNGKLVVRKKYDMDSLVSSEYAAQIA